jgi:colanic acid/amylovoran biosynthesis glycosyltransferase
MSGLGATQSRPSAGERRDVSGLTPEPATRVAFIVSRFPCYDEAFLLREISALSRLMDVRIFALRRAKDRIVHDEALKLLDRVVAPPYILSFRILRAHVKLMLLRPRRYVRALWRLVGGNLASPGFLLKNLAFFPKAGYLADWAERSGITHIHACWATYPASAAMLASEITGIPYSFAGHAHDLYLDTTHLAEKVHRASFVTTCTASNKRHLSQLAPSYPEDRLLVVHHGVSLSEYAAGEKGDTEEILSVGTLYPHKGFQYLVSALGLLETRRVPFHATIVGGGPLESRLREQIAAHGLDGKVSMTGPLKQADVISRYKKAAILILMAQSEWHWGIPNVIIEGIAAGAAVITTRFGSVEELIRDGETGLLVPPKDPEALASALERLIRDRALRKRLALAGQALVARDFDLDRAVDVYFERFRSSSRPAFVSAEA